MKKTKTYTMYRKVRESVPLSFTLYPAQIDKLDRSTFALRMSRSEYLRKLINDAPELTPKEAK